MNLECIFLSPNLWGWCERNCRSLIGLLFTSGTPVDNGLLLGSPRTVRHQVWPLVWTHTERTCVSYFIKHSPVPLNRRTARGTQQHPKVCWIMFDLYLTLILMLNSPEYLLPLCGVYCMVTISLDCWTNYCKEFGRRIFFFSFLFLYWSKLIVWG